MSEILPGEQPGTCNIKCHFKHKKLPASQKLFQGKPRLTLSLSIIWDVYS